MVVQGDRVLDGKLLGHVTSGSVRVRVEVVARFVLFWIA